MNFGIIGTPEPNKVRDELGDELGREEFYIPIHIADSTQQKRLGFYSKLSLFCYE